MDSRSPTGQQLLVALTERASAVSLRRMQRQLQVCVCVVQRQCVCVLCSGSYKCCRSIEV
jgi:hypothetical protein